MPTALVGCDFASSKGMKDVEPERYNPIGEYLQKQEAKTLIDPVAAQTLLDLSAAQLVPAWVISQIDVKQMRAAAR